MSAETSSVQPRIALPELAEIRALSVHDWVALLSPHAWLGHTTPEEFIGISGNDILGIVPETEIDACFAERCVRSSGDALVRKCLLDADVRCIAHALSALLSLSTQATSELIPAQIRDVIGPNQVQFDHIGVEVFGRLEWYIELFDQAYAPLGINVVHEHIFPSVQVRRALAYDEELKDVRIGRIYFSHGDVEVNLEVFEATQSWKFIALRQAALYAHLRERRQLDGAFAQLLRIAGVAAEPVGHVAFRVASAATVEAIQNVLLKEQNAADPVMRPYVQQVFFNPSDSSTNTKFVVATDLGGGLSVDSQIIEIVSYESPAD
ncbi:MAG: hypothetical protein PVF50_09320 [Gammaproteobacteria bacterium]